MLKAKRFFALACATMLWTASAYAQCNLESPPCPGAGPCGFTCSSPLGGCGAATPIANTNVTECTNGSFDLRNTQYENTCSTAGCTTTVLHPPLRFFKYNDYVGANYGCGFPGVPGGEWMINPGLDFAFGTPGHWMLFQTNWAGCSVGGCPAGERTVAEISDVDLSLEGTTTHDSWFLISSVDFTAGSYDFDRVTGGTTIGGCGEGSPPVSPVAGLDLVGRTTACTDTTIVTMGLPNASDIAYCDVDITLREPSPPYFTEGGFQDAAVPLIAGYQIVYTELPTGSEPTSSDPATGNWQPVHDTATPAALRASFIPVGTAGAVTVTVPSCPPGGNTWLGTRIVYQDDTLNQSGSFSFPGGPALMSPVSAHCGPVNCAGDIFTAVEFDTVTATHREDGVLVRWSTLFEDDLRGFSVYRQAGPDPTEAAVEVTADVVRAYGAGYPYEFLDTAVDPNSTYYYYVLERTLNGAGDRSMIVEAARIAAEDGGITGQRDRKRSIR